MLIVAVAGACFAFAWWVGRGVGIPYHQGFEASLFQQPGLFHKLIAFVVVAVVFLVTIAAAHIVAGRYWIYSALVVAPFAL